ncbi:hypothetical protein MRX96_045877 [Rhipicephalus microplus]
MLRLPFGSPTPVASLCHSMTRQVQTQGLARATSYGSQSSLTRHSVALISKEPQVLVAEVASRRGSRPIAPPRGPTQRPLPGPLRHRRDVLISTSCLSSRYFQAKLMKEVRMEEPCFKAHLHRSRGTLISTSCLSGCNSPRPAYERVEGGQACFTGWTRVDVSAANGEVAVVCTTLSWYGIRGQGNTSLALAEQQGGGRFFNVTRRLLATATTVVGCGGDVRPPSLHSARSRVLSRCEDGA